MALKGIGLASRYEPNDIVVSPIAVNNHQKIEPSTHAQQIEPLLSRGVIRIINKNGVVVGKRCLGLVECDTVLALILPGFGRIPIEVELVHSDDSYSVRTMQVQFTTQPSK